MCSRPDSTIRIYRAEREDKSKARAIVDEYCEAVDVVVRDTAAAFDSYFTTGSGLWLAERATSNGSQVVGCIILRPLPQITEARAAEVKRLYVVPGARGMRIADDLLAALHAFASRMGYEWVYLDTKDDLRAAIKFYHRQGYEDCKRYNDNPQATLFMRRRLSPADVVQDG